MKHRHFGSEPDEQINTALLLARCEEIEIDIIHNAENGFGPAEPPDGATIGAAEKHHGAERISLIFAYPARAAERQAARVYLIAVKRNARFIAVDDASFWSRS